jgi:hypothetical protein
MSGIRKVIVIGLPARHRLPRSAAPGRVGPSCAAPSSVEKFAVVPRRRIEIAVQDSRVQPSLGRRNVSLVEVQAATPVVGMQDARMVALGWHRLAERHTCKPFNQESATPDSASGATRAMAEISTGKKTKLSSC